MANHDDVADWNGAAALIGQAVRTYGRLDILVNNAGILRDAYLHRMTEEEWDLVVKVHLKGHFAPLRHAAEHWKLRQKAGEDVRGAVVNTASASGTILPNAGQVNYGAAKAGIAAMTLVAAAELGRVGVRVNGIAPVARTRLTEDVPMIGDMMRKPDDPEAFDAFAPEHVSPLVAHLASERCAATGRLFNVGGGSISEIHGWTTGEARSTDGPWTVDGVAALLDPVAAA